MADSESASTSTSAVAPRLLRQLGYSLALCNNDGTILERDDDWSEIVGRTDDELLTIEADLIAHHPGAGGEAFRRDLIPLRRGDGVRVIEFVNVPLDDKPGHLLIAVREAPGQAADDLMANYLAALVETVDDAVVGTLPDGTIILWNDAATAIYGYGPADAIGQSISMVVRPEDQQALEEALRGVARGERINRISVQNVTRSGDLVNLQVSASPTRDGDGKITGSVFTGRDVSATREADRLARIYIGAIEHSPNGLVVFQSSANEDHFTLLAANHVGRRCLRLAAESIGKTIRELAVEFPPLAALPSTFDAFPIDEGRLDLGHHEVIDIDGRERTLETWAFGLPDRVIAFGFSDVTDHTGAERERDALLARVADAEDAERKRLAEALHDDTIQVLAAANMELGSLRRRAVDAGVTRSAERVEVSIRKATHALRSLVFELYPPDLDSGGLAAGLRALCSRVFDDLTDVEIIDQLVRRLGTEARMTAYRIAQEAIGNIRRHAQAENVTILLAEDLESLVLTIEDDGVGIPAEAIRSIPGHLGLTTMRERAESHLGTLTVRRREPSGTHVQLRLPNAFQSSRAPAR